MLDEQLHNCNPVKYGCATCLPHRDGDIPLNDLPRNTTKKLAGMFSTLSLFYAKRQAGKLSIPFFKVFWYDSTKGMYPKSTDCKADALTTTRSRREFALANLSSPPSFLLPQSLWHILQELFSLSSCTIRLRWVPDTLFSWKTTRLISWPDGERYSCSLQSLVVSLILSLVFTLVFSRTGAYCLI